MAFGHTYVLAERIKEEGRAEQNEQDVLLSLTNEIVKHKSSSSPKQVYKAIQVVFEFLNGSKVGFLRGDLHSRTFFELNKDL